MRLLREYRDLTESKVPYPIIRTDWLACVVGSKPEILSSMEWSFYGTGLVKMVGHEGCRYRVAGTVLFTGLVRLRLVFHAINRGEGVRVWVAPGSDDGVTEEGVRVLLGSHLCGVVRGPICLGVAVGIYHNL